MIETERWLMCLDKSIGIAISWGDNYKGDYICLQLPFVWILFNYNLRKKYREQILVDLMKADQEDGLYDD